MKEKAVVVGGGAAGMMASIMLGERGFDVTLLEKNEKLGKKIFITGKGRCNFTNDCEPETFFESVISNPRFMYSSYYAMTAQDLRALFESWGLETKVERGQRAFPASDHAYDVIDCLKRQLKRTGVTVHLNTEVTEIRTASLEEADAASGSGDTDKRTSDPAVSHEFDDRRSDRRTTRKVTGVRCGKTVYRADRVIIATGGLSYPTTGSTGDGYKWAEALGHKVTDRRPSLVALNCAEQDLTALQGLSLKNVSFTVKDGKKSLYEGFGEMLFTHFGVTGPLILTASAKLGKTLEKKALTGRIDLKPAVAEERLDRDLVGLLNENANRDVRYAVRALYPASLVPVLLDRSGIPHDKKARDITKEERRALLNETKAFGVTLTGLRGYNEAVITQGGVSVKQIDPATMASKLVDGLYFAGEVLDLDAVTGGFNLQIAWATGAAAGRA